MFVPAIKFEHQVSMVGFQLKNFETKSATHLAKVITKTHLSVGHVPSVGCHD